MPVPHCFDYQNFVISTEIGKRESSNFVLLFQNNFGYSISLVFLYWILGLACLFLQNKAVRILIRIALDLQMNLGSIVILKHVKSWDFPDNPLVKILRFHCRGHRFNPWSGFRTPYGWKKKSENQSPPIYEKISYFPWCLSTLLYSFHCTSLALSSLNVFLSTLFCLMLLCM